VRLYVCVCVCVHLGLCVYALGSSNGPRKRMRMGIHIAFALLPKTLLVFDSIILHTSMICDAIMLTHVNKNRDSYCVCVVAKDSSGVQINYITYINDM